jgi:nicotinic acid mononucleotide adenylyltransferase
VPVSSSDIRARIANGESVEGLVPPAVAGEMDRLGLYR